MWIIGGVLQALSIMCFNFAYQKVLVWLTDLENWQVRSSCPPLPPHLSFRILAPDSCASSSAAPLVISPPLLHFLRHNHHHHFLLILLPSFLPA